MSLEEVQGKLQAVVDQLLGEAVAPDQPLMEAGLDSIGAESSLSSIPGCPSPMSSRRTDCPDSQQGLSRSTWRRHTEKPSSSYFFIFFNSVCELISCTVHIRALPRTMRGFM